MVEATRHRELSIGSVLHPTDFSWASELAFVHALALTVAFRSRLTLLHVETEEPEPTGSRGFPRVSERLERWGVLPEGSSPTAVFTELGLDVKNVDVPAPNALEGILRYVEDHGIDCIVLTTHARGGLPAWIRGSVSGSLTRMAGRITLVVPQEARAFVEPETGALSLRRILIPVREHPKPGVAITTATGLVSGFELEPVELELLHVGEAAEMPAIRLPSREGWSWRRTVRSGKPSAEIVALADEGGADLIVMATRGRESLFDGLLGSTIERVLRGSPCPVLAVPPR